MLSLSSRSEKPHLKLSKAQSLPSPRLELSLGGLRSYLFCFCCALSGNIQKSQNWVEHYPHQTANDCHYLEKNSHQMEDIF